MSFFTVHRFNVDFDQIDLTGPLFLDVTLKGKIIRTSQKMFYLFGFVNNFSSHQTLSLGSKKKKH